MSAPIRQYIVDAFTDVPFSGNPAAVCLLESWLPDDVMQLMARENNLSETAFIVKESEGYRLRWFTPGTEVELCGHATLASAFVVLNHVEPNLAEVSFNTLSGRLSVSRAGDAFAMEMPTYELTEIPVTDDMEAAFGHRPAKALLGLDLICVFESEGIVRAMRPNQALLASLPGRLQNATALGSDVDCVSRSFAPKLSVAEDPVCGSAHCQIGPYWASLLGKSEVLAYQASERGGYLRVKPLAEGRVRVTGQAALVAVSEWVGV